MFGEGNPGYFLTALEWLLLANLAQGAETLVYFLIKNFVLPLKNNKINLKPFYQMRLSGLS